MRAGWEHEGVKNKHKNTEIMPKGTTTTRIKTNRPVTESELLNALKNSMTPIFAHLEEKLLEGDGKVLDISISVKAGKIELLYGIGEM